MRLRVTLLPLIAALLLLTATAAEAQVTLQLDPNDHSRVLVSNVPAGTNHLHFYEANQNTFPASSYQYVDKPPTTTSFRPVNPSQPWVDVAAMPTSANGTPIDQWWSSVGGRILTTPDTVPPDTTITSAPADGTSTSASFSFTSTEPGTFECSLDGAAFTSCSSPKTYTGLAIGTHTFNVRAKDDTGNTDQSPALWSWTISAVADTTPPDTSITGNPSNPTTATSATFAFASTETGSTFACALDGAAYSACTTPASYTGLAVGSHTFSVRATDSAGNVDPTPATFTWTINDNQVRIALDPNDHSEVLVSNVPPGTDHLHFWEGNSGTYPAPVMRYVDKPPTTTTFRPDSDTPWVDVAAMPTATNGTPTGQWYSDFSGSRVQTTPLDTTPPDTTITTPVPDGTSTSASISFTSTESGTFACALDTSTFTACSSPKAYSGLAVGSHTFKVRATDAAGNTDPTPATDTWTITAPPSGHLVGVNAPWFMGAGGSNSVANGQVLDVDPDIIRDPAHVQATWNWVAANTRAKIVPEIESANDTGFLSWAVTHPAFSGVVELSNEPYWNNISASSWVSTWGPVINFIKANYPTVKLTAPIDDWPTAHNTSPGTAGWTQQLLAARPALKTEMYGWAIHPYCDSGPTCALQHLQNGINALKANGVPNPHMWATEWGWSTGTGISEATKASNANAFLSNQPPELEASEWYQMNANANSVARENGFGLYVFDTVGNWCCWHSVAAQGVIKQFAAQP